MDVGTYYVLDENGYYLNLILVSIPYPENYYPGYGRYILYAGPDPAPEPPTNKDITPQFTFLDIKPSMQLSQGYQMDINTGVVTPPPPQEIVDDIPQEYIDANLQGLS